MKIRIITTSALAISLGAGLLLGEEEWKRKPYTEWTISDVETVLYHSAWSRTRDSSDAQSTMTDSGMTATKRGGFTTVTPDTVGTNAEGKREVNPGTETVRVPRGTTRGTKDTLFNWGTIQWESSLTVRQALERSSVLHGQTDALLAAASSEYAIAVSGGYLRKMAVGDVYKGTPLQSAYLRSKQTNVLLYPIGIKRDYVKAVFYFPKESENQPLIGPADKQVEFRWTLGKNHVETTFDLRKMMRDGKPDL